MFELFNWLLEHPDVKLQIYSETFKEEFRIRITKGRFNAEYTFDMKELFLLCCSPKERLESVLDNLYEGIKREEQKYE